MAARGLERGFTLLEMMIVVALVSIIAVLAVPNLTSMYRRSAVRSEARRLYGAFVEAQGLAALKGVSHCLLFDRDASSWSLRRDDNEDGNCDADDGAVQTHGRARTGADGWPDHVAFGPAGGASEALPAPYDSVALDAWCTPCGAGNTTGAVFFDIDSRIVDGTGIVIPSGAIMLHDQTGESGGLVEVLMFIGPTGNIRLFSSTE